MDFNNLTLHQFNDFFKDEATCYKFYEEQRWAGVPACPHCGTLKTPYKVKPRGKFTDIPSYRCAERACDLPFTVRTGTIYEGSKVELRKWFQAAYELSTSKKGISSIELGTRIGVSQKTAWFINHRLRAMLAETQPEILEGTFEIDETYVGGKEKNKSKKVRAANKTSNKRNAAPVDNKIAVFGILQRDGKVIAQPMVSASKEVLLPLIAANVSPNSTIVTDGLSAYRKLSNDYALHVVVNHAKDEWVKGPYSTNTIEGFWSLFKRGIIGIYHSVSPKHLHRYCNEFTSRYNNRKSTNIYRFSLFVQNSGNVRLTYKQLTSGK